MTPFPIPYFRQKYVEMFLSIEPFLKDAVDRDRSKSACLRYKKLTEELLKENSWVKQTILRLHSFNKPRRGMAASPRGPINAFNALFSVRDLPEKDERAIERIFVDGYEPGLFHEEAVQKDIEEIKSITKSWRQSGNRKLFSSVSVFIKHEKYLKIIKTDLSEIGSNIFLGHSRQGITILLFTICTRNFRLIFRSRLRKCLRKRLIFLPLKSSVRSKSRNRQASLPAIALRAWLHSSSRHWEIGERKLSFPRRKGSLFFRKSERASRFPQKLFEPVSKRATRYNHYSVARISREPVWCRRRFRPSTNDSIRCSIIAVPSWSGFSKQKR